MSNNDNLRVPLDPAFYSARQRHRPASPHNTEEGLDDQFLFSEPTRPPTLRDIDIIHGIARSPSPPPPHQPTNMASVEQQLQQLREIADSQQRQLAEQQRQMEEARQQMEDARQHADLQTCLLYTSPSPRDGLLSRMPSSA